MSAALRVVWYAAIAGMVTSCAAVARMTFLEPSVALREIQVTGIGIAGGTLTLVLDVHNPNSYAIQGVALATDIAIDETPFGRAELAQPLNLPARDSAMVEIPVQFTWAGVGAGARSLLRSGSVPYTLVGVVRVQSPIGEHEVDVDNTGRVSLRDLMRDAG